MRTEAHRISDARRYARLSVSISWSLLEHNLYNYTSGCVSLISDEGPRLAKEDCESAERLLHAMVAVVGVPRHSRELDGEEASGGGASEERVGGSTKLEVEWCESLNVLGFALTCLGCEVPAIRKHEEALGATERLGDVVGNVRASALRGLAMLSVGLRDGEESQEGARCMVRALKTIDDHFGKEHVLSVWVVSLCSFALGQLTPEVACQVHPLSDSMSLAIRAAAVSRARLESANHPLVAYTCGSSAKILSRAGQYLEALALAEVAVSVFREQSSHGVALDNIAECTRNIERDVDNYRRKARRSTRMGHDSNQR